MSNAQRLQQSAPHELEREGALFPIGLPHGISSTQFCETLSRDGIAVTTLETDGPGGRAAMTCPAEQLSTPFPHNTRVSMWFKRGEKEGFAHLIGPAFKAALECGPTSIFNVAAFDESIFSRTPAKSNFLFGPGYRNAEKSFTRNSLLPLEEACTSD